MPCDLPDNINANHFREPQSEGEPDENSLAAYEEAAIGNALIRSSGNRKKAAQMLGTGEAALYRKLIKYQI